MTVPSNQERSGERPQPEASSPFWVIKKILSVKRSGVYAIEALILNKSRIIVAKGGTQHDLFDPTQELPTTRLEAIVQKANQEYSPYGIVRATRLKGKTQPELLQVMGISDADIVDYFYFPVTQVAMTRARSERIF